MENIITGKRKFTVIKGGITEDLGTKSRSFLSSYITDTRLMGVLGLYIHWETRDPLGPSDLHQFFYLDAEEFGFESYTSLVGNDSQELLFVEKSIIGGLGGSKSELNEDEARYVLQEFAEINGQKRLPWPEDKNAYAFLLNPKVNLSPAEKQILVGKICAPIVSEYQLVHYFLMRLFARDFEGASYLIDPKLLDPGKSSADNLTKFSLLKNKREATLCKNVIDHYEDENGLSYMCESLVETNYKYSVIVSEITLTKSAELTEQQNQKVYIASAKERSSFRVTPAEAALMLNRPEFLTVYEIATGKEEFDDVFLPLMNGTMMTQHDDGRLFLEFNKDNSHVNRKTFRLNDDIHCLFYSSDYGQLIISAYSMAEITEIERRLRRTPLNEFLILTERYEFKDPVLYEFIQSDFEDFAEFLDSIE